MLANSKEITQGLAVKDVSGLGFTCVMRRQWPAREISHNPDLLSTRFYRAQKTGHAGGGDTLAHKLCGTEMLASCFSVAS